MGARPRPDATSHPSLPVAFRSTLSIERCPPGDDRWAAHLKVDYDVRKHPLSAGAPNPLSLRAIRRFADVNLVRLTDGRLSRADVVDACVYRTRKGHHLRIWFRSDIPRLPAETILAMQAALGDDMRRQIMNEARVAKNQPNWNVLWVKKYVNGALVGEEVLDADLTKKVRGVFGLAPKKKGRGRR
jgi:hypothetical protein